MKTYGRLTKLYIIFLFLAFFLPLKASAQMISQIIVKNNQRIETATVKSYLTFEENSQFNAEKVSESVKNLFATNLFEDIKINFDKNIVTIIVTENPLVGEIAFEGNKRINDESLVSEISLKSGTIYTKSKLKSDVDRIISLYQKSGRFAAEIEPKLIKLDQNRVNIVFEIKEGDKSTIKTINFIGNKNFTSTQLKKVINTREDKWWNFFSSSSTYDEDRINYDKELLRKHYTSLGYANFNVESSNVELSGDKKSFVITFTLDEGDLFKYGAIDVKNSLPGIDKSALEVEVNTISGNIYNLNDINSSIDRMTDYLNNLGYAFVDIKAAYQPNQAQKLINVTYIIEEGPKVYIDKINITGNVRTLDKVIRREFKIAEGDPFNASKIKRSRERVQNLGFFEKVEMERAPSSFPDKTDIVLDITEKSTGELNFGAGFSTTDGALANVSIRERNLLGKGQDLKASVQYASKGSYYNLGFTEPYFMDKDLTAGFDLFNSTKDQSDESSFDSKIYGTTVRFGYSISEYLRHNFHYSFVSTDITDIQTGASSFIRKQEGNNLTSSVGHSLLYDKRDYKYDPTSGYYLQFLQDFAGIGGDSKFIKHEVKAGYYIPTLEKNLIWSIKGRTGNIFGYGGNDIRINERFFIGGSTIRGFENAGIGPRDIVTGDSLGGKTYYFGSVEAAFPLGLPQELGVKGSFFLDTASLFDTDDHGVDIRDSASLRASIGFGIYLNSPLGPIKLDFSHPILKEDYDKTQFFQFNFGTRF